MSSTSRRTLLKGCAMIAATAPFARLVRANDGYLPAVPESAVPKPSPFGFNSTAEEVTAGMDLTGRTALVTGCNSGLGYETMRVLAMRGAHVIGAARTLGKAETACASVDGKTTPVAIELTDFDLIAASSAAIRKRGEPIDMLILNAGIMRLPELDLVHGVERQFAVNHLGHFLLTEHLLPAVVAAPAGRVVVVSSGAHRWAGPEGLDFDNLDGSKGYDPRAAYGVSKIANGLFSRELARRLHGKTNATSNSLHPGVIRTNLSRHLPPPDPEAVQNFTYKTISEGAATTCYVATSPDLAGVTGFYFSDCNVAFPLPTMQDDDKARRLWALSEELTSGYRLG